MKIVRIVLSRRISFARKTIVKAKQEFRNSLINLFTINEPLFANGQLDFIDRQIIAFTALGYRIETIADKIGMSEHGIKKRKSKIRDILNISKGGDEELLKRCRNLNLLLN